MKADILTVEAGIITGKSGDKTVGSNKSEESESESNWLKDLVKEAVTDLVMDIADTIGLADLLGHSDLNTTRIYTRISMEEQISILDQVEKKISPDPEEDWREKKREAEWDKKA